MYLLSQRNIGEYRIVIRHLCEAVTSYLSAKYPARYAVWKSTASERLYGSIDSMRSSAIFYEPSTGIAAKSVYPLL